MLVEGHEICGRGEKHIRECRDVTGGPRPTLTGRQHVQERNVSLPSPHTPASQPIRSQVQGLGNARVFRKVSVTLRCGDERFSAWRGGDGRGADGKNRTGDHMRLRLRLWLRLRLSPWTSNEELSSVQSSLCASPRQNARSPVRLSPSLLMPLGFFIYLFLNRKSAVFPTFSAGTLV